MERSSSTTTRAFSRAAFLLSWAWIALSIFAKPSEANLRNEALEKLDILTGRIKGATQFRAINLIPGLSTTEKGMLARIFRNLMEHYPQEEAQKCIDMILSTYSET